MPITSDASPRKLGRRADDIRGRELLLDLATELFSERGIASTTIAQIATAAHVTSAMVHYWFDTRDKLIDAVAEERVVPFIAQIWDPASLEQDDADVVVDGLLTRLLEVTRQAPWLPSLWLREIIQEGGELRQRVLKRIPREQNIAFHKRIAQAQAQGEVNPDIWPEVIFLSILGLVMLPHANSRMWSRMNPNAAFDRQRLERHIRSLLFNGLAGNARGRSTPPPKERP